MPRNTLVCFTNCKLALENGSIVQHDLWFDKQKGIIVDAQKTFYELDQRPSTIIDLGGDIVSPGFLDIQINGAYGFDFSIFPQDDPDAATKYDEGLRMVASRIVETGVTSLLPTIIGPLQTQQKFLYTKILPLLAAVSHPKSATLLGWHAEGPFLHNAKRGAHMPEYLLTAPDGFTTFESVYGPSALQDQTELTIRSTNGVSSTSAPPFVRMITAAPEIEGVISAIEKLSKRGVVCSIGHSIASSDTSLKAVQSGARLITHLFNAMPQLHHRDPSIIGLLGASSINPNGPLNANGSSSQFTYKGGATQAKETGPELVSEALSDLSTPPQTPIIHPVKHNTSSPPTSHILSKQSVKRKSTSSLTAPPPTKLFQKPYYGIIVDGCHSHAHSVRLAYSAHPGGCILVTDAMPMLDPHLQDGLHDWRDDRRLIKDGVKLYIEGTDTLAGSVVTLDICVRNFVQFTGCTLGEALKCVTYNPAACLKIEHRKGTLRPGADADFVILDSSGYVKRTWVGGEEVWSFENSEN